MFPHGRCLPFVLHAANFVADLRARDKAGGVEQPAGEHDLRRKLICFLSEQDEDLLRDILGGFGIADLPQGGGIDEVDITSNQLGKRLVSAGSRKLFKKLLILHIRRLVESPIIACGGRNVTDSGKFRDFRCQDGRAGSMADVSALRCYSKPMAQVWINGKFEEEDSAGVSLRDTGLLHAAGVFTTMRASGGRVFRLSQHLARIRHSCEVLFIPLQYSDEQLRSIVGELLERNGLADARMRLTITRGAARQDPLHGLRLEPTVFLTAAPLEPYPREFYERGMTVLALDDQKLNPYDAQAGHKTLNYFSRLAALREANQRGAGEALWFDVHHYLQSGSISNVFLVKGNALLTPPTMEELRDEKIAAATAYPKSAVLPGITRAAVLDIAREEGIEIRMASLSINDLLDAEECFLTNSIMRVMPVCRVERRALGDERPGAVTRRVSEELDRLVEAES